LRLLPDQRCAARRAAETRGLAACVTVARLAALELAERLGDVFARLFDEVGVILVERQDQASNAICNPRATATVTRPLCASRRAHDHRLAVAGAMMSPSSTRRPARTSPNFPASPVPANEVAVLLHHGLLNAAGPAEPSLLAHVTDLAVDGNRISGRSQP
jgi:hypothetical protein